jgi:hypothetical protein
MVKEAEAARVADEEMRRQIEALCASGSVGSGSQSSCVVPRGGEVLTPPPQSIGLRGGSAFATLVSTPYDANVYQAAGAVRSLSAQLEEQRKQQADKDEAQYMQLVALQKANGIPAHPVRRAHQPTVSRSFNILTSLRRPMGAQP